MGSDSTPCGPEEYVVNPPTKQQPDRRVISLGASTGGLAVTRALGRRGMHVIAVAYDPSDIALRSKYVSETVICPHPDDVDAFLDFMLEKVPVWGGLPIIESGDYYAKVLSLLKPKLEEHYRFATPEWEVLCQFIEKEHTYKLAEECGVRCPRTYYPESVEHLIAMEDEVQLPCIVKPVESHKFVAHFNTKLFEVHTFDELVAQYRRWCGGQPVGHPAGDRARRRHQLRAGTHLPELSW